MLRSPALLTVTALAMADLLIGSSTALAQGAGRSPPLECVSLELAATWGLLATTGAGAAPRPGQPGDAATCGEDLDLSGLPGLSLPDCRAAMARILDDDAPDNDALGAPFDDVGLLIHDVLSGSSPDLCAAVRDAP